MEELGERGFNSLVIPGLGPGIHVFDPWWLQNVDGRVKPGHDGSVMLCPCAPTSPSQGRGKKRPIDLVTGLTLQGTMPLRLLSRTLILLVAIGLAACDHIPRTVAGLPMDASWDALPLRKWLAEDRAEPIALSFCAPPSCSPGLAVSVIRLKGRDAAITDTILKDPERLARALRSPVDPKKPVRTEVSVERLKDAPYPGFTISLTPMDGKKPPAFGAALGHRSGKDLKVVLVIGLSPEVVQQTARDVAARELGT
ncbi:hypothetical protein [Microvirga sp. G4-2]|uniref:hypothetical protein n=1 Tax=Microvirga sp. G4-2 TaxID=3434467 RepID=UPI004044639F